MKKPIWILSFVALFVLISFVNAATRPKDVYGWDKLKWGMNGAEIKNIFKKNLKKRKTRVDEKEKMYSGLELVGIEIGNYKFRASLWMKSDSKTLSRIVFVPDKEPDLYEWVEAFINLEHLLKNKYGSPDIQETYNDPATSAERIWNFPSTEVELSYLRLDNSELLLLVYSKLE